MGDFMGGRSVGVGETLAGGLNDGYCISLAVLRIKLFNNDRWHIVGCPRGVLFRVSMSGVARVVAGEKLLSSAFTLSASFSARHPCDYWR